MLGLSEDNLLSSTCQAAIWSSLDSDVVNVFASNNGKMRGRITASVARQTSKTWLTVVIFRCGSKKNFENHLALL